jgi:hypothetical protein
MNNIKQKNFYIFCILFVFCVSLCCGPRVWASEDNVHHKWGGSVVEDGDDITYKEWDNDDGQNDDTYAEGKSGFKGKYMTPLDLSEKAQKQIERYEQVQQENLDKIKDGYMPSLQDSMSKKGYLLDSIVANRWVITRGVVWGFEGISNLRQIIASPANLDAIGFSETMTKLQARKDIEVHSNRIINISEEDIERCQKNTRKDVEERYKTYIQSFENLEKTGFFGHGDGAKSIYDKSLFVGIILLTLTTMARMGWMAYTNMIKGEGNSNPMVWTQIFIKFVFLLLLLMFMKKIIFGGIAFSDLVRDFIAVGASPDGGSAFEIISDLLEARLAMTGASSSTSFIDLIRAGVGQVFGRLFTYIGYALASVILYVILILSDVLMSLSCITAPIVIALSMAPTFEHSLSSWVKGYITLLFYGPLAAVYAIILIVIMMIGLDSSALAFILISIVYIMGATQIPHMAKSLSGTVLAGTAIALATAPMKLAQGAGRAAAGGVKGFIAGGPAGGMLGVMKGAKEGKDEVKRHITSGGKE